MSIVKRVEALLKMESKSLINAAIMTAIINPRKPVERKSVLSTEQLNLQCMIVTFQFVCTTFWHDPKDQSGIRNVGTSGVGLANLVTDVSVNTGNFICTKYRKKYTCI